MFRAYAKINLGLRVLDKRPDGYHNIETIFHHIDVFDEIEFARADTISVVSSSSDAPSGETNICHKAAKLLAGQLGINAGVRITITKRIPVGAGLGGGSSDAATVLRELPSFWDREVSDEDLRRIALQLGSDVPFFLGKESARGTGRGELLDYFFLDIPYTILLCNPGIHVSTAWAYQHVRPAPDAAGSLHREIVLEGMKNPRLLAELLVNDFEAAVFRQHPEIRDVKLAMQDGGAVFALMSGSGSSVYGLFDKDETANSVKDQLDRRGFLTFITPPHFSLNTSDTTRSV